MVELVMVVVSPERLVSEKTPPPRRFARLSEKVELSTVTVPPPRLKRPAPSVALLPEKVESVTASEVWLPCHMPPPLGALLLPEKVELFTSRVPSLRMAPPSVAALLPEKVESVTVAVLELPFA